MTKELLHLKVKQKMTTASKRIRARMPLPLKLNHPLDPSPLIRGAHLKRRLKHGLNHSLNPPCSSEKKGDVASQEIKHGKEGPNKVLR